MALTIKRLARLVKPGRYGDNHGLYLQVVNRDNRSSLFRYERGGRERFMGLGPLHTINLYEARERARKARQLLLDGIDPLEARAAEKNANALAAAKMLTFEAAARAYFDAHERSWKNAKHRNPFLSTMNAYAFASIDTGLVLKCIEPIWNEKTETASRVRGRIESILDWATVRGYRTGDNPARWKGHLAEALPARAKIQKTQHLAALPFDQISEFMAALRKRGGLSARALEFTILTAARTGEVTGARWEEFDLAKAIWTVPAGRIKGGREHRVPLTPRTLDILRALPNERGNPFIFIGQRADGLSNMALAQVLKRMSRTDVTVHGFRSTFRDWAAERTNYPNHVVEMALAHVVGSKVEAAYRRGDLFDKRRHLMVAWAEYCSAPAPAGEVVPLHRA